MGCWGGGCRGRLAGDQHPGVGDTVWGDSCRVVDDTEVGRCHTVAVLREDTVVAVVEDTVGEGHRCRKVAVEADRRSLHTLEVCRFQNRCKGSGGWWSFQGPRGSEGSPQGGGRHVGGRA